MNDENLIPLNKRSKDEAKKIQTAGGVARGKQRTEEKTFKKVASWALEIIKLDNKNPNIPVDKIDAQEAIVLKAVRQAINGDDKARRWLSEIVGETNNNKNVMVNGNLGIQEVFVTAEEKARAEQHIKELLDE